VQLERPLDADKTMRVIGFDDAPFERDDDIVDVAGVVCADTRFEGMHWLPVTRDGFDATDALVEVLAQSKFLEQVHAVLLDGIAFGGFNVVDLAALSEALDRPCIAVMRREPDMEAIARALEHLPEPARRMERIEAAGPIHRAEPFVYQVRGATPDNAARLLARVTDTGHVPEALRLAHLIGSAIVTGTSSRRA
jgi:hypothetical protein